MRGLLAGFATEPALREAVDRLERPGFGRIETFTPVALDSEAPGSPLPLAMFTAGMLGFIGFFGLMSYADLVAYPENIGGRPGFAWPAFMPIAFELAVLCAMLTGFTGYFAACRMPRPYDPVDHCANLAAASRDGWFVAVYADDPDGLSRVRAAIDDLAPSSLEEFEA